MVNLMVIIVAWTVTVFMVMMMAWIMVVFMVMTA